MKRLLQWKWWNRKTHNFRHHKSYIKYLSLSNVRSTSHSKWNEECIWNEKNSNWGETVWCKLKGCNWKLQFVSDQNVQPSKKEAIKHKWLQIIVIIMRNVCEAYTKQQNWIIFSSKIFLIVPYSTQTPTMHSNIYKHTFFSALYNFLLSTLTKHAIRKHKKRLIIGIMTSRLLQTTIFNITLNI